MISLRPLPGAVRSPCQGHAAPGRRAVFLVLLWLGVCCGVLVTWSAASPMPQVLLQQGLNAFNQGHFAEAISQWQEAERLAVHTQQPEIQGMVLFHLAQAYEALGHYDRAIQTLEAARTLAEKTADHAQIQRIMALLANLSITNTAPDIAEKQLHHRLDIAHTQHDLNLEALLLNDLGNLLMTHKPLGREQIFQAVQYYTASTRLAQEAHHLPMAARALIHTAMAQLQVLKTQCTAPPVTRVTPQGLQAPPTYSPQQVQAHFDQALHYLHEQGATHTTVYDLINIGLYYGQLRLCLPAESPHLIHRAATILQQAAAMAQELGDQRALSYATGYLGRLYEDSQDDASALRWTEHALHAAQAVQAPEIAYQWHWQMGRLLVAQGTYNTASVFYKQAIRTVQALRHDLRQAYGQGHVDFQSAFAPLYTDFANVLLQQADGLQKAGIPQHDQRYRGYLEAALDTMERLKQAELEDYWGDACVTALKPRGTTSANVLQVAASVQAVVIYPIILPERLELLVGVSGALRRLPAVPIPARQLKSAVMALRRDIEQEGRASNSRPAQELYDWLIRPVLTDLASLPIRTIVVVPDGILRTVPFAALYASDRQQYLIEQYALAITPGLQLIDPQPLAPRALEVLAMGVAASPRPEFPPLPHVEQELETLQKLLGERLQLLPVFRRQALHKALRTRSFPVVHIASHTRFAHDGTQSAILTANGQLLTMHDLQEEVGRLRFRDQPLELLTLSACKTAIGDDEQPDERAALGLAGVALQAGARSVLGSLWQVESASTALLMEQFYLHLQQEGTSKAEALRQAQRHLLTIPQFRHPYYWAGFLLLNNWL